MAGNSCSRQDISREASRMVLRKSTSRSSASTAFLKLHSYDNLPGSSLPLYQLRHTTCSTNPLLIPIISKVPRETQPKRILVRQSEVQMLKIHPFSYFYYYTIILSSTLSVRIVCNSPWTEKADKANGWQVPPVVTRYDYSSSADCKHQSRRDLITPIRELVLSQS